jgi:hypothetical protein
MYPSDDGVNAYQSALIASLCEAPAPLDGPIAVCVPGVITAAVPQSTPCAKSAEVKMNVAAESESSRVIM